MRNWAMLAHPVNEVLHALDLKFQSLNVTECDVAGQIGAAVDSQPLVLPLRRPPSFRRLHIGALGLGLDTIRALCI